MLSIMADEIADAELADDRLRDQLEAERHVSVGRHAKTL